MKVFIAICILLVFIIIVLLIKSKCEGFKNATSSFDKYYITDSTGNNYIFASYSQLQVEPQKHILENFGNITTNMKIERFLKNEEMKITKHLHAKNNSVKTPLSRDILFAVPTNSNLVPDANIVNNKSIIAFESGSKPFYLPNSDSLSLNVGNTGYVLNMEFGVLCVEKYSQLQIPVKFVCNEKEGCGVYYAGRTNYLNLTPINVSGNQVLYLPRTSLAKTDFTVGMSSVQLTSSSFADKVNNFTHPLMEKLKKK